MYKCACKKNWKGTSISTYLLLNPSRTFIKYFKLTYTYYRYLFHNNNIGTAHTCRNIPVWVLSY